MLTVDPTPLDPNKVIPTAEVMFVLFIALLLQVPAPAALVKLKPKPGTLPLCTEKV